MRAIAARGSGEGDLGEESQECSGGGKEKVLMSKRVTVKGEPSSGLGEGKVIFETTRKKQRREEKRKGEKSAVQCGDKA